MRKALLALLLIAFALPFYTIARPVGDPPRLNGQWKGALAVPGGSLNLFVTIVPLTDGSYYAALDVPQQRINRMPVEVVLDGNDILLRIEQAGSKFQGKIKEESQEISGTWTQPGLSAPLVLTKSVTSSQAVTRLRLTPPYREEDVIFLNPSTKYKLSGTLTIPAGEGPFPAVALISDLGPQDREVALDDYHMFGALADYLTRRGVAVLRFDDRGVGKSGGKYATATTVDFMTDAQAALAYLRTRSHVAPHHVGLIGHGEGANVALMAAAQKKAPDFVVSLAGYGLPGLEVMRRQQSEIMRLVGADRAQVKAAQGLFEQTVKAIRATPNQEKARADVIKLLRSANTGLDPAMAKARAVQLTSPWSRYFFDFNPQTSIAAVQCPVLLLNGTADLQVSASQNLSPLQKGLRQTPFGVTVQKFAGVNHWFQADPHDWPMVNGEPQANFSPQALETMRAWLMLHAKPVGTAVPVTVKRPAPTRTKSASKTRRRAVAASRG